MNNSVDLGCQPGGNKHVRAGAWTREKTWWRGLYSIVRELRGLTKKNAAAHANISVDAWQYREQHKALYHASELLMLYELSGLTADKFLELLKECK